MPRVSSAAAGVALDTSPVDLEAAVRTEAAEGRAWVDLYDAAPSDFAEGAGLHSRQVAGTTVLSWKATGRRYFSRAIGLGLVAPATPEAIDDIIGGYEQAGIEMFLV